MRAATEAKAERAYQMRKRTGCTWKVIADSLGYSRVGAWQTARRWAKKNRRSWPPGPPLTFGKICYQMAAEDGMTWKEIAYELDRSTVEVLNSARGHCRSHDIDWPWWGRFNHFGQNKT
jgi:hypothetical protein